jgi:hypothetical protein
MQGSSGSLKRAPDAPPALALGAMNFGKRTPAIERALSGEARTKLDELARAWLGSDTHYVR